jgi:hypothetical protein
MYGRTRNRTKQPIVIVSAISFFALWLSLAMPILNTILSVGVGYERSGWWPGVTVLKSLYGIVSELL